MWEALREEARAEVMAEVRAEVRAEVMAEVRAEVKAEVRAEVMAEVRAEVMRAHDPRKCTRRESRGARNLNAARGEPVAEHPASGCAPASREHARRRVLLFAGRPREACARSPPRATVRVLAAAASHRSYTTLAGVNETVVTWCDMNNFFPYVQTKEDWLN
eukprot:7382861-Prymnesium_polylepis.2